MVNFANPVIYNSNCMAIIKHYNVIPDVGACVRKIGSYARTGAHRAGEGACNYVYSQRNRQNLNMADGCIFSNGHIRPVVT